MKKFAILLAIIILSCFIGGLYGILHDFLTYSISPEYYTRFKFIQFGLVFDYHNAELYHNHPLIPVALVGWMATWWMGLIIGTILGLVTLRLNAKTMFTTTLKAIGITIAISFITGLAGLLYGWLFLMDKFTALKAAGWQLPEGLDEPGNFIIVGSMHNFSYIGGALGLAVGIVFVFRKNKSILAVCFFRKLHIHTTTTN
ncbi:MAG: hypothetical protein V4581_05465 [Bacteroidota bacterium]